MRTQVITDSTSYLPEQVRREYNIEVVSLTVNFETESFREVEIDNATFYRKMAESKKFPSSSQPPVQDIYQAFENPVRAGNAVVAVFLSSEMSGTYSTALLVRDMIHEKYPAAVIEVIDSRSNCMEMGFAVMAAARAAQSGKSPSEVADAARHVIGRSRFLFVPDVLDYLKKGGRIGGAAALIGSVLQIRPVLTVVEGKTYVVDKVRTTAKAIETIVGTFLDDVRRKGAGEVVVHHISNELEGHRLAARIEKELGRAVEIVPIGPVIGCHVGPGSVGLAYYTRDLREPAGMKTAAAV